MISKKTLYTFTFLLTLISLQNLKANHQQIPIGLSHQGLRNMKNVLKQARDLVKNGLRHEYGYVYAHVDKEAQLFIWEFRNKTTLGLKESSMPIVPCYPIDLKSTILDIRKQLANRYNEIGIKISYSHVILYLEKKNSEELTKLNNSFNQKRIQDVLKPLGSKILRYKLGYPTRHLATMINSTDKETSFNYKNAQKNPPRSRVSMYKEKNLRDVLKYLQLDYTQPITKKIWLSQDNTLHQVKKYVTTMYNETLFNRETHFQLSEQSIILYVKQVIGQIPEELDDQFDQQSIKTVLGFSAKKPLLFSFAKHIKMNVKTDDKNDIIKVCKFLSKKNNIKELPRPIVPVHSTLFQVSKQIASECDNTFAPAFVLFYGKTNHNTMIRISSLKDDYKKTTIAKVIHSYKLTGLIWSLAYYLQLFRHQS